MNAYYRKIAESIIQFALTRSDAATELRHHGFRGRAREIFVRDLLTPFLSPNIGTCTGVVVDSDGGNSRQIDVIVYDKNLIPSLMFTGEEGIVPIESVLATVEIKSRLTKGELVTSIRNAHSIKDRRAKYQEIMMAIPEKSSPLCCLFAFSSDLTPEKELSRLESAVSEVNNETDQKVYVPLSGVCIGNVSFTHCLKIEYDNTPKPTFETLTTDAALRFMVFLVDQIAILERQRSKMLISHYFVGASDA
jgi:hypothetical protein